MASIGGSDTSGSGPGHVPSPHDLEAIAREASRGWRGPAPFGGPRWTREDLGFAVSILAVEAGAPAFLRALRGGMTRAQARRYLVKALHNSLRKRATRARRVVLLDDLALDGLASGERGSRVHERGDADALAERLLRCLNPEERSALAERLVGPATEAEGKGRKAGASRRTRARHWARVRSALRSLVQSADLGREDMLPVLRAVALRLGREPRP